MIKMVVFLGNYGDQYRKTRHNIGWLFEESLNNTFSKTDKFKADYYKKDDIVYILPKTLMNKSGESVIGAMQFFKIDIKDILVVHDDLETEFGSFKIKNGGGLAGHNGLRSIKELTGSSDFKRLALGISRPAKGSVASYVLQRFNIEEESQLDLFFNGVHDYFFSLLSGTDKTGGKKTAILQPAGGKR